MAVVKIESNRYTVDALYQWDKYQVLEIRGLSLAKSPEIHFANATMDKAIVRQAVMDSAGVITVSIPNSLLQKPYKIAAHVCQYSGDTFETLYKIIIPVEARPRPTDYTLEANDEEIYSFNALENMIVNTLDICLVRYDDINRRYEEAVAALKEAKTAQNAAATAYSNAADAYNNAAEKINGFEKTVEECDRIVSSVSAPDTALSATSTAPVQNKAIHAALAEKMDKSAIVLTTTDPGAGASVSYPDGTVIMVYE